VVWGGGGGCGGNGEVLQRRQPPPTSLEIRRGCSSRGGADIWLGAANFSFLNTPRASLNLISLGV